MSKLVNLHWLEVSGLAHFVPYIIFYNLLSR